MAVLFLAILFGGYIAFRSSGIFLSPPLDLYEPLDGALISADQVTIRGETEPSSRVTINGYEVFANDEGIFDVVLPFRKGFHLIDVKTKNKLGKETSIVRQIVVE